MMNRFRQPKGFSWSYTRLRDWRTCPRKFDEVTQRKNYQETYTEEIQKGYSVHGAFARYVDKGMPLPTGWKHLQGWADDAARKIIPEQITFVEKEVAITRNLKSTGYWASNAWLRTKLDQLDLFPRGDYTVARVIDFKTGNPKDDIIQLALYAATVFATYEDVTACRCEYWWIKVMDKTHEMFQREDMADLWAELLPELKKMEEAEKTDEYPPRKNGLCKEYCPVITCEFNGRRG